jgi:hypothetical protein
MFAVSISVHVTKYRFESQVSDQDFEEIKLKACITH